MKYIILLFLFCYMSVSYTAFTKKVLLVGGQGGISYNTRIASVLCVGWNKNVVTDSTCAIVPYDSPVTALQALQKKQVDFIVQTSDWAYSSYFARNMFTSRNKLLRRVLNLGTVGFWIMTSPSIHNFRKLQGKKVLISAQDSYAMFILQALQSIYNIRIQTVPYNGGKSLLSQCKQVSAFMVFSKTNENQLSSMLQTCNFHFLSVKTRFALIRRLPGYRLITLPKSAHHSKVNTLGLDILLLTNADTDKTTVKIMQNLWTTLGKYGILKAQRKSVSSVPAFS